MVFGDREIRYTVYSLLIVFTAIDYVTRKNIIAVLLSTIILSMTFIYGGTRRRELLVAYIVFGLSYYYVSSNNLLWPIFVVFTVLYPYYYSSINERDSVYTYLFFANNSIDLLRMNLFILIASVVKPMIVIASLFSASILALIIMYRKTRLLDNVDIDIEYSERIVVGSKPRIKIALKNRSRRSTNELFLNIVIDEKRITCKPIHGECFIELDEVVDKIGVREYHVEATIIDDRLFTAKNYPGKTIAIRVLPSYEDIISRASTLRRERIDTYGSTVSFKIYIADGRGVRGVNVLTGDKASISSIGSSNIFVEKLYATLLKTYYSYTQMLGEGSRKTAVGEYYGVREYQPGDKPRDIFWKKSISRLNIYVKEYVSGEQILDKLVKKQKYAPVIVFDPLCEDLYEFDRLVKELLAFMYRLSMEDKYSRTTILMVLGVYTTVFRGYIRDLFLELVEAFKNLDIEIKYSYRSVNSLLNNEQVLELYRGSYRYKAINAIIESNNRYASRLIEILFENNISPPRTILLIHGRPVSTRYSIVKNKLEELGFDVKSIGYVMGGF